MKHVFIVGSIDAKQRIIVDRIFKKKKEAIIHCESRKNSERVWVVKKVAFGAWHADWIEIYKAFEE